MNQPIVKEKILYIINPNSGTRYKGHLSDYLYHLTDKTFFDVEICTTRYKGEATKIVRQKMTEHYRYFVAVGGDGTINEIAKELINSDAVLGIIPLGSGNGLARHLRIPLIAKKAVEVINGRNVQSIDYGIINDLPFFCTCGVGFDALISEKFDQGSGRGLINYIKITLKEFFRYIPETYELTIDNQPVFKRKAFLITFANASEYGNNALIAPDAKVDDGKLDICIIAPFRLIQSIMIGIRLFTGNIGKSPSVSISRSSGTILKRDFEGTIHIDGETQRLGRTLEISLVPSGLKVILP